MSRVFAQIGSEIAVSILKQRKHPRTIVVEGLISSRGYFPPCLINWKWTSFKLSAAFREIVQVTSPE